MLPSFGLLYIHCVKNGILIWKCWVATHLETEKKVIDKAASSPYSDVNDILPKLSADEQTIVSAIGKDERLVDDVIAETGLPVGKVLATLTLLEVKGVVKRLPGKRVRLG